MYIMYSGFMFCYNKGILYIITKISIVNILENNNYDGILSNTFNIYTKS